LISSYRFAFVPLSRETGPKRTARVLSSQLSVLSNCVLKTDYWIPSFLPGRLRNPGNFASQRQSAETQAADAEFAQVRSRTSAKLAAIVLTSRKLRLLCRFGNVRCSGHP